MFRVGDKVLVSDNPTWFLHGQDRFDVVDEYAGLTGVIDDELREFIGALHGNFIVAFSEINDAAFFNPKCLTLVEDV